MSEDSGIERVGPVIDLMGFAVAGPGHFLASGHPGPGVDLPQPVGLIESTDGGSTWQQLSRQGQSDFHVLAVSQAGVLGFDGSLLGTADRQTWAELAIPAQPFGLAASPDGRRLLATTQQGLLRSADAGRSWTAVGGAPLLQVVDWAGEGESAAGVNPTGGVWRSADGGSTWQLGAQLGAAPQAIDVSTAPGGARRIIVATDSALVESMDGGQTFAALPRG